MGQDLIVLSKRLDEVGEDRLQRKRSFRVLEHDGAARKTPVGAEPGAPFSEASTERSSSGFVAHKKQAFSENNRVQKVG